jgi:hypothetical protein
MLKKIFDFGKLVTGDSGDEAYVKSLKNHLRYVFVHW